jgi:acyl carrier protein
MELLKQEIRSFVVSNFLFNQEHSLHDDDSFMELGIVDSTGVLELVSFLEDKYGIEIGDELSPENLDSVSRASRFVSSKLKGSLHMTPSSAAPAAVPQESIR